MRRRSLRTQFLAAALIGLSGCATSTVAADPGRVPLRQERLGEDPLQRQPLRQGPPPAVADQYRDFCRNRPAGCAQNYQRDQAPFREDQAERALDRLREHERRLQFPTRRVD